MLNLNLSKSKKVVSLKEFIDFKEVNACSVVDQLEWWKDHESQFPLLAKLV